MKKCYLIIPPAWVQLSQSIIRKQSTKNPYLKKSCCTVLRLRQKREVDGACALLQTTKTFFGLATLLPT